MGEPSNEVLLVEEPPAKGLDSWKEIASYLNRDITTVQRWEKREGMPVHRHVHDKRGSVYAVMGELDAWIKSRSSRPEEAEKKAGPGKKPEPAELPPPPTDLASPSRHRFRLWVIQSGMLFICLSAAISWLVIRHRDAPKIETTSQIRSLAVLPLQNLSGDPAQDYLADGMTEALIGRLANIHDLHVISHTSVMRFKDQKLSIPEIAKTLAVDAIVEGSVIKQGDRIRVTAQLIHGTTDEHFWSETYDREMRDALTLESELAVAISEKVAITVTGEEHQRLSSARPVAPEVYESYLKGRFVGQGNRPGIEESIHYFQEAIDKDPAFAPAYVGLAHAYAKLGTIFAGGRPDATRPKEMEYARKALELDPDLVDAHAILASMLKDEWHWTEAEAEYRRALALDPNSADANAGFALWLISQGRTDEAVARIQRARALDPVAVSGSTVALILFRARLYDDAIRESRSTLAVQPENGSALLELGFALIADNKPAEAIPVLEKAISVSPGSPAATGVLIRAYAHAGRRSDALRLLAELKQRGKAGYIPSGAFINAYLGLDDKEQAFYWLEEAYKEQSNILQFLKTHPYFDPIRGDPRFVDLLRRVGLS